ncbi:MAG: (2Fe-2S)-binding protein, partial [Eubacterium sp.]|nr:(2Fe-2S)-binding protein [Eubacterium sp.]
MDEIKFIVDGKKVTCKKGKTVLQAARSAGIYIPSLCEMQEIDHAPGACRMCVVEVEGAMRLLPSCTTLVTEGM